MNGRDDVTAAESAKRMGVHAVQEDILATANEFAKALHRIGALDAVGMRDMDRVCQPSRSDNGATESVNFA